MTYGAGYDTSIVTLLIYLHILGIYFEQLLSFYFSHHPSFTLVCKNLQANSLERTIGEYDFIVLNNHTNEYYHIEVAVKFYLGFQSLDVNIPKNAPLYNWHYWLGPNKKDTLAIKMRHLLEHQLRLSEKSAGIDALRTIGIKPGQLNIRLLMTGRFYYPAPEDLSISLAAPEYSNPQGRQKQYWFSAEYISHYLLKNNTATSVCMDGNVTDIAYTIIPRQQWMSDLALADIAIFSLTLLSREQLLVAIEEQVTHQKQQLHIAELTKVPTQPWQEEQRFFVIP